jgi:hypothetical protein
MPFIGRRFVPTRFLKQGFALGSGGQSLGLLACLSGRFCKLLDWLLV